MKAPTILCFHSVINTEIAPFHKYQEIFEEIVELLNTHKLKDKYPESFYYLKAKVKGGYKYYAGSVENSGQWNDPKIVEILDPPDGSGDQANKGKRRKGN